MIVGNHEAGAGRRHSDSMFIHCDQPEPTSKGRSGEIFNSDSLRLIWCLQAHNAAPPASRLIVALCTAAVVRRARLIRRNPYPSPTRAKGRKSYWGAFHRNVTVKKGPKINPAGSGVGRIYR